MRFDRRDFLRISGAGALAALGCEQRAPTTVGDRARSGPAGTLQIDFTGLVLLQQAPRSMVVHLVDGPALQLGEHVAQLWAPAAAIDQAQTARPAGTHVKHEGEEFWLWDLKGLAVTTPAAASGEADLTVDETSTGSAETPATEAAWSSLEWVPSLRTLSGATKITRPDALVSSLTLTHGHVASMVPDGVGRFAVWRFTAPDGQVLLRRALTNRVRFSAPTAGAASILIGSQPVVFRPGADARLRVMNLPPEPASPVPCPSPCHPNMNHFAPYFGLVDANHTPTIALHSFTPPTGADVHPDYCPPGRI